MGAGPESYARFRNIIKKHFRQFTDFKFEKRFDFYDLASKAYAVVVTSETDGNLVLKKGPVMVIPELLEAKVQISTTMPPLPIKEFYSGNIKNQKLNLSRAKPKDAK